MKRAGSVPASLTSDLGSEFSNQFRKLLETKGIDPRQKDKDDINAIATIDTAIGNLKKGTRKGHAESGDKRLGVKAPKSNEGSERSPKRG